jgi:hypothetical protein
MVVKFKMAAAAILNFDKYPIRNLPWRLGVIHLQVLTKLSVGHVYRPRKFYVTLSNPNYVINTINGHDK